MPEYFFHLAFDLFHPSNPVLSQTLNRFNNVANLEVEVTEPYLAEHDRNRQGFSTSRTVQSTPSLSYSITTTSGTSLDGVSLASSNPTLPRSHPEDDWRAGEVVLRCLDMSPVRAGSKHSHTSPQRVPDANNGLDSDKTAQTASTKASGSPTPGDRQTSQVTSNTRVASETNVMSSQSNNGPSASRLGRNLSTDPVSIATKGAFEPLDSGEESLGWGVIRLYREYDANPVLSDEALPSLRTRDAQHEKTSTRDKRTDDDCSTLCVLAVPSYMTPSDFLGFAGERAREDVSHFRMIRTERINRYMVLMKFRSGKRAKAWRAEWNGKPYNDVESECCHVVFVASVKFRVPSAEEGEAALSFPATVNDPFTPSQTATTTSAAPSAQQQQSLSARPMAPPTPALKELPTCPVCLERMDESTGLLTILCRHVFHCSCLQKWRGSGCPVCRYTLEGYRDSSPDANPSALNECTICHSDTNLWICLICGNVGCGRYDAAHAYLHHKQTSHPFAMDLVTQRVWDYDSDGYVHRILQSKTDGKLLELPSIPAGAAGRMDRTERSTEEDADVPTAKLDALSLEYSHLLTSQLDSQRVYFEQKLEKAADRASRAAEKAAAALKSAEASAAALMKVKDEVRELKESAIPRLDRERERAAMRAEKFESAARHLEKEWREEKAVSGSIMERVEHLDKEVERLVAEKEKLAAENAELEEQNRDLGFFISGKQKLEELEMGEEVESAKVEVAEEKGKGKKGKGRKGR